MEEAKVRSDVLFYSRVNTLKGPPTSENEDPKLRCAVSLFDKFHAVTFSHDNHSKLSTDSPYNKLNIYNEEGDKFEVTVVYTSPKDANDFVLLRCDKKLSEQPPVTSVNPSVGNAFSLLGFPEPKLNYQRESGVIQSNQLDGRGRYRGTGGAGPGYSGGPVLVNRNNLVGICVGGGPTVDGNTKLEAIHHSNYVKIVPSSTIMNELNKLKRAERKRKGGEQCEEWAKKTKVYPDDSDGEEDKGVTE